MARPGHRSARSLICVTRSCGLGIWVGEALPAQKVLRRRMMHHTRRFDGSLRPPSGGEGETEELPWRALRGLKPLESWNPVRRGPAPQNAKTGRSGGF